MVYPTFSVMIFEYENEKLEMHNFHLKVYVMVNCNVKVISIYLIS